MKYACKHNHVNHPLPKWIPGLRLERIFKSIFSGGIASNFMYFSIIFMFFKFLNKDNYKIKQDFNLKAVLPANK